jgi:hypothetical protein
MTVWLASGTHRLHGRRHRLRRGGEARGADAERHPVRTGCACVSVSKHSADRARRYSALLSRLRHRQVEEGISKPLATLTTLPKQALQGIIDVRGSRTNRHAWALTPLLCSSTQDPDTKLLRSVAGSVRVSTEKNIRERCGASHGKHKLSHLLLTHRPHGAASGAGRSRWTTSARGCKPTPRSPGHASRAAHQHCEPVRHRAQAHDHLRRAAPPQSARLWRCVGRAQPSCDASAEPSMRWRLLHPVCRLGQAPQARLRRRRARRRGWRWRWTFVKRTARAETRARWPRLQRRQHKQPQKGRNRPATPRERRRRCGITRTH